MAYLSAGPPAAAGTGAAGSGGAPAGAGPGLAGRPIGEDVCARRHGPAGRLPAWSELGWLTVPGSTRSVAAARDFLARLLDGQPDAGTTVLLASELVANSVLHSDSRRDGGTVTVAVFAALSGAIRVEVTDDGGPAVPLVRDPADLAPGGRGLRLVDALSARWGFYRAAGRTVSWFETETDRGEPRFRPAAVIGACQCRCAAAGH